MLFRSRNCHHSASLSALLQLDTSPDQLIFGRTLFAVGLGVGVDSDVGVAAVVVALGSGVGAVLTVESVAGTSSVAVASGTGALTTELDWRT